MADIKSILSNDYVSARANEQLSQLIGRLVEEKQTEALIFDEEEFLGMFSHAHLPRPSTRTDEVKVRSVTIPAPQLSPDDDILTAAQRMFESGHEMLPVVDNEVIGVVYANDVLKALRDTPQIADVRVIDVKHPRPYTLTETDGIGKVFPLIKTQHIDHFPVVSVDGTLAGFLSIGDLLRTHYLHQRGGEQAMRNVAMSSRAYKAEKPTLAALPVSNFMNNQFVITIAEQDSLRTAIDTLTENNIYSLVLVRNDKPYGIVTVKDVLEGIIASQAPQEQLIQYKGLKEIDVDDYTAQWIRNLAAYYTDKIRYFVKNEYQVTLHIKQRSSTGNRHRYTVITRVTTPGAVAVSTEAREWDLRAAVHEAFQELEAALAHTFQDESIPSVKKLSAQEGDSNLPGGLSA